MSMTNKNMAPPVPANPGTKEEDPLRGVAKDFHDQVAQESKAATSETEFQSLTGKSVQDLTEDDAYDLRVPINAGAMYDPNSLKIVMKDSNYIARWCNRNNVRQSQLVAMGFRALKVEEVVNIDTLQMFEDGQGHFVFADLVAMKIPKQAYYAGLRQAYLRSLHATNSKKAAEAGANFATSNFNQNLGAAERNYMQQHQNNHPDKPVYNPAIGV